LNTHEHNFQFKQEFNPSNTEAQKPNQDIRDNFVDQPLHRNQDDEFLSHHSDKKAKQESKKSTFFVQTGAGTFQDPICKTDADWTMGGVNGFVYVSIDETTFTVDYMDTNGDVIFSASQGPRIP
jgi:hypothetical protein